MEGNLLDLMGGAARRRRRGLAFASTIAAGALACLPGRADAAVRKGRVVLQKGDVVAGLAGSPIALTVDTPVVTGTGKVGFRGTLSIGSEVFIFVDDAAIFRGADFTGISPTGTEPQVGVADGGMFAMNPYVSGDEYFYTHRGVVIAEGDAAPGFTNNDIGTMYRSKMAGDGTGYFFTTVTANGSTSTIGEAIYEVDELGTSVTPVLIGGQLVDGVLIESTGLDYDYAVSKNGAHWIAFVDLATGSSTNDYAIVKDGAIVMQEGTLINSVETWQFFDLVDINDLGNYVVSGDTSGSSIKDEFVAYNGQLVVREGMTIDGVDLSSTSYVYGLAINNDNHVMHTWYQGGNDYAFITCDPANFADRSRLILEKGDEIDVDDDNSGDYIINDIITSSSYQTGLGTGQVAYFEVRLDDGVSINEAIIEVPYGCCGNMMLEGPEECDDGNDVDNDGCTNACRLSTCGDGILDTTPGSTEECDDGNANDGDACTNSCLLPVCGDGITSPGAGEECDDQNAVDDDACTNSCTLPDCGDGVLHAGEQCDDGNSINNDDCTNVCTTPICGDGVRQMGEACDDGNDDDGDACTNNCALATCGDGVTQTEEECDDGNDVDDDDCTNVCLVPICGDGIVQAQEGEQCDDGNVDDSDDCTVTCLNARCGDGIINGDDECDDGNKVDDDACTNGCTLPGCGDGVLQPGEDCDDGNSNDYDMCNSACEGSMCGDGVVQAPEECDDGNMSNDDACTNACVLNDDFGGPGMGDGGGSDGMDTDGDADGNGSGDGGGCSVDGRERQQVPWLLSLGLLLGWAARQGRDSRTRVVS